MATDLRKLETLRIAAQCTIEKWQSKDSKEMGAIEDAARDMYAMASDFENEMSTKYGIPRSFAYMMESIFGEVVIEKLFKIPKTK